MGLAFDVFVADPKPDPTAVPGFGAAVGQASGHHGPDRRFGGRGYVGTTDIAHSSVLHVPGLSLVVSGDVAYNQPHMWLLRSTPDSRATAGSRRRRRPPSDRRVPPLPRRLRGSARTQLRPG